ncbi:MAG: RNA degradosome polyphosphate kinase [Actinomycetota bacterium]|nr:RNA degradosome polyphosphate kinase [Actinomycetota bacterium]
MSRSPLRQVLFLFWIVMTHLPEERYFNRELSWIDFNDRVLTLAEDRKLPLLERVKFLAIFASNLDEFYMVRVAGLKRQVEAGLTARSSDGRTPREQLAAVAEKMRPLVERHDRLFLEDLLAELGKEDVDVLRWADLSQSQSDEMHKVFNDQIFPVLTPLAVDPGHPFPYISNLSLNLAVIVNEPDSDRSHFARVKVPPLLPRFFQLDEGHVFVPIEDIIAANLGQLFAGMKVVEHHYFRVTRNADLEVNDDGAEDLLQALEEELRKRRFSPAVRLEIEESMPDHVLELLRRELEVGEEDVHALAGPLDLTGLWDLYEIERPELKAEPFHPATSLDLQRTADDGSGDIFEALRRKDVLVHHPYESFATSVEQLVEQAADDPDVLAIKQTLYRTSGDSPIVNALIDAAESGKQVVVLVEIKARFDERANINWARALEEAGCHVVYGLVGLKTHSKLCLVVRQEKNKLRRYVHVGTGNYNPKTARIYEDLGLLTADPEIGAEVSHLFNFLTGYSRRTHYQWILAAPYGLREQVIALIEREAELHSQDRPGYIAMKLNSLVDEDVIDALYVASQAGVKIDLVLRSICSLRPGVPELSENITVRSVLGRFLEHSRILYFRNGGRDDLYIGSADMMQRNLDRRVEAVVNVKDKRLQKRLVNILELSFADNSSAWELDPKGRWFKLEPGESDVVNLQEELMRQARQNA